MRSQGPPRPRCLQWNNAIDEGSSRALSLAEKARGLAACKILAPRQVSKKPLSTRHSSGLPAPHTHRTHLHSTRIDLSVEIATLIAVLTLHTAHSVHMARSVREAFAVVAACCTGCAALAASKPWGGGQSASKPPRELLGRGAYSHFETIPTRWNDMDAQSHVNNAVYHFYIDDAVNLHLARSGVSNDVRRFTSENSCRYLRQLSWPTRAGPVSTPHLRR